MLAHAATDYVMPDVIRSIFLDKANGYTSWAWMNAVQGKSRSPHAVYNLGVDGAQVVPVQAVMLPAGNALLGVAYGATLQPLFVSSGV